MTSNRLVRSLRKLRELLQPSPRSYRGLLRTTSDFKGRAIEWQPGAQRVLVLAPHMDDEVIGCGGTIARHVAAGGDVTVAFMTDGRFGSSALQGLEGETLRQAQQRLVDERKEEARRALAVLGVRQHRFLDARDGELGADRTVAERLRELIRSIGPHIVYLPFFLEHHPDHRAVSDVLLAACEGESIDFQCYGYEVWTPLPPNCLVRIDATMAIKKEALSHYHSQLADSDFQHGMQGLAAYRSVALDDRSARFVEAFCALPLADYRRAYRSSGLSAK